MQEMASQTLLLPPSPPTAPMNEFFFENNAILMENHKNISRLDEIVRLAPCQTTGVRQGTAAVR